ncbi:kelch repeat-containing protein [Paenibacillus sp. P32E]|uniref:Kelch repeat-containing protein n=1 Tax=Paenibacillus sp. P32E TaxID=1349434 RepID=UPI0009396B84|nr:kelch repeat-containing protein [Paenibacillus sp. P32E]OKP85840.1 hypothetical protein A3848_22235 [Paenibacillus sp. P32E]
MNTRNKSLFFLCFILILTLVQSNLTFASGNKQWIEKAPTPTARQDSGSAAVNGIIYVIGGHDGKSVTNTVEAYNPSTNTWETKAPMPTSRYRLGVVELDNKIYAIGGTDNETNIKNVEVYDPTTDSWEKKADLPAGRGALSVVSLNGKIYAIGGMDTTGNSTATTFEYDPISNKWTSKAGLSIGRIHGAAAVANGKIYFFGGIEPNSQASFSQRMEEYNPVTNVWASKASLPTGRYGVRATTLNNRIFAVGGYNYNADPGGYLKTVEEYDPILNTWETKENLKTGRSVFSIATVNGKVYVMGGKNTSILSSTEVYSTPSEEISSPSKLTAIPSNKRVDLNWAGINVDALYNIKRSEKSDGPYTTIANSVTGTTYRDINVINGTTYYYVVTAITPEGESNNSNEASATPQNDSPSNPEPSGDHAILTITLSNGIEKEFDLSIEEVNAFLNWYDAKDAGTGPAKYAIDKHNNNKGPFAKRTEYVIFDKILTFEVSEYTAK